MAFCWGGHASEASALWVLRVFCMVSFCVKWHKQQQKTPHDTLKSVPPITITHLLSPKLHVNQQLLLRTFYVTTDAASTASPTPVTPISINVRWRVKDMQTTCSHLCSGHLIRNYNVNAKFTYIFTHILPLRHVACRLCISSSSTPENLIGSVSPRLFRSARQLVPYEAH